MEFEHISVMRHESIEFLNVKPDGIYVDGTLGAGGHSSVILNSLRNGHLYAFDKDSEAIETADKLLKSISNHYTLIHQDNRKIREELARYGVSKVDGILLDLGVSSYQFDNSKRGFSYRTNARLDMRMDQESSLDAYQVVNTYSYEKLSKILYEYGEEPYARLIAKKICEKRQIKPIETTFELVDVIKEALPFKQKAKKGHPAKQTFQAIRIEVNQELESLKCILKDGLEMLNPNGRFVVITFHSLEDRIVKLAFNEVVNGKKSIKGLVDLNQGTKKYRLILKKPLIPTEEEIATNPRAHSAKLRVIEKI